MTRWIAAGAMVLGLSGQTTFAMDPEQAGREARQSLQSQIEKQQGGRTAAVEKTADNFAPIRPARGDDGRANKSIGSKVRTICIGC